MHLTVPTDVASISELIRQYPSWEALRQLKHGDLSVNSKIDGITGNRDVFKRWMLMVSLRHIAKEIYQREGNNLRESHGRLTSFLMQVGSEDTPLEPCPAVREEARHALGRYLAMKLNRVGMHNPESLRWIEYFAASPLHFAHRIPEARSGAISGLRFCTELYTFYMRQKHESAEVRAVQDEKLLQACINARWFPLGEDALSPYMFFLVPLAYERVIKRLLETRPYSEMPRKKTELTSDFWQSDRVLCPSANDASGLAEDCRRIFHYTARAKRLHQHAQIKDGTGTLQPHWIMSVCDFLQFQLSHIDP